jgi:hypothetical protein
LVATDAGASNLFVCKILGYMLQFTDSDKTTEVPDKLPDGFLLSDADYNLAFASLPFKHLDWLAEALYLCMYVLVNRC